MSIGERIIQLRKEKNINQNQLAQAMGVSRQAVSKWENGRSTPDPLKLIQLAELLGTDVEYLSTGRQSVPTRPPVVLTKVETVEVEKIVEKPVIQVIEKIVERPVEVPVEVPVVRYIDRPVVKKLVRNRYLRNPTEYVLVAAGGFLVGLLIGIII